VRRNPRLRVGIYNQHFVDRLPMEEDPITYLRRLFNEETYQSVRNRLGKYGLEGHAHTIPMRDLSGGQKARVVFVELSLMAPHLLFLDVSITRKMHYKSDKVSYNDDAVNYVTV
jgi:ATP-binding cassette subfamily F protein 1